LYSHTDINENLHLIAATIDLMKNCFVIRHLTVPKNAEFLTALHR